MSVAGEGYTADSAANTPGARSVVTERSKVHLNKENMMMTAQTPGGSREKWLQKEWMNPCLTKLTRDKRQAQSEVLQAKQAAAAATSAGPERDLNDFER